MAQPPPPRPTRDSESSEDDLVPMDFSSGIGRILLKEVYNATREEEHHEGASFHPRTGPVIHGSFENQPWFFPHLRSRREVQRVMENNMPENPEGLFFVSGCEEGPTVYCLVFVKNREVHHRIIRTRQRTDGTVICFVDDEADCIFEDITELVEYYATIPDIMCDGGQLRTRLRYYLRRNDDPNAGQAYVVVPFNPPVGQPNQEEEEEEQGEEAGCCPLPCVPPRGQAEDEGAAAPLPACFPIPCILQPSQSDLPIERQEDDGDDNGSSSTCFINPFGSSRHQGGRNDDDDDGPSSSSSFCFR